MKNKAVLGAILGACITLIICLVIGTIQVGNNKFTYYKASVLAENVDYFAVEHLNGLYSRAEKKFAAKDYAGALKDLEMNYSILKITEPDLKERHKQREKDIACVKSVIDLNEKIKKTSGDYKLYLRRANIQGKPKDNSMFFSVDDVTFCSDWETAYSDYDKALKINPHLKDVYSKRADALGWTMNGVSYKISEEEKYKKIFEEKEQKMLEDYKKAIELNGRTPELLMKLAGIYNSIEQPEKAIPLFEEVIKDDYSAYYGLALSYERLNQPEKVIENIDKFIESRSFCKDGYECICNSKYIYYKRAKANFKLHRFKDAYKDFRQAHFML